MIEALKEQRRLFPWQELINLSVSGAGIALNVMGWEK